MQQEKKIYICENTPDGIFTALYEVWTEKNRDDRVLIRPEGVYTYELFATYHHIKTDMEKAVKVARSIRSKISGEAYRQVYAASLSREEDKIEAIFAFLKLGFQKGSRVTDMHGRSEVCRMFELCRNVTNEANTFQEFLRFAELENGVLLARIKPLNFVLPLMADHFQDRFPEENFAIIDDNSEMGVFHQQGKGWFLSPVDEESIEKIWKDRPAKEYEQLWKTFFRSIAIEQRKNYKCQRNLCALRYRNYMPEFED